MVKTNYTAHNKYENFFKILNAYLNMKSFLNN